MSGLYSYSSANVCTSVDGTNGASNIDTSSNVGSSANRGHTNICIDISANSDSNGTHDASSYVRTGVYTGSNTSPDIYVRTGVYTGSNTSTSSYVRTGVDTGSNAGSSTNTDSRMGACIDTGSCETAEADTDVAHDVAADARGEICTAREDTSNSCTEASSNINIGVSSES
ncbi:hypothetical protein GCM10010383_79070 [Streptomyces lomondensis]|uniref:Uncharacterized protein n=1 Tax=Streptomyces lomondensis TaxID=68229 RepID=A0ABQ2XWC3_9ACTN|nr:hypothetical protein GCM10010383_79070 [Streptomyces lomondensis]